MNADSVQLYRGHRIGAAQPSEELLAQVPHHLFEVLSPSESSNVANYRTLLQEVLNSCWKRKRLPLLSGGSTLYLSTALNGLDELPAADPEFRREAEKRSSESLWSELKQLSPELSEKLHPNDRVRVIRAVEIKRSGGCQTKRLSLPASVGPALILVLLADRRDLYAQIASRSRRMVGEGLLEEAKSLLEEFGQDWVCSSAIGYAEAVSVLKRELSESKLPEAISRSSRRYAKRQMTFWRNAPEKYGWSAEPTAASSDTVSLGAERSKATPQRNTLRETECYDWNFETLLERILAWREERDGARAVWYLSAARLLGSSS